MRACFTKPTSITAALALALALTGCTGAVVQDTLVGKPETRVRVSGSGTCLPLLRILAAAQPNHEVRMVFLPGLHTKGGVRGVIQGSLDIGAISRSLTPEEDSAGLKVTWLSSDGLAIAANESVARIGIKGLTSQQVRDIYSGKVTDWKQLGADRSMPIVVLDRHEDESAKIIMRQYVFGPKEKFQVTPDSVNLYYESDMVDALRTTEGSIGYFSLGFAVSQSVPVTLLALDGVVPSVKTIESGAYKVVRPLGIVIRAAASPTVREFSEWAASTEAKKVLLANGYAPYHE